MTDEELERSRVAARMVGKFGVGAIPLVRRLLGVGDLEPGEPEAYKRIGRAKRIDRWRAKAGRGESVPLESAGDRPAPAGDEPEEVVVEAERQHMLAAVRDALCSELENERQPDRTILEERLLEGKSYAAIAARLGWTADRVRQRAHRGRKRLLLRLRSRVAQESAAALEYLLKGRP
jgi:RNA polymerase sigma factor (sigma-70 family)